MTRFLYRSYCQYNAGMGKVWSGSSQAPLFAASHISHVAMQTMFSLTYISYSLLCQSSGRCGFELCRSSDHFLGRHLCKRKQLQMATLPRVSALTVQ